MPTLAADRLEQFITTIFERAGAPTDHARCVADHLVRANLAGHDSHGAIRVPQYIDLIDAGRIKPAATMEAVTRLPAGAVVDGRGGFGQVIARDAMRLAIELAKQTAIGAVAVRNCSHTGRIGTYTEMAAAAGLVGIATVNSGGAGHAVAPFGGTAPRLSTNPISIAAPTDGPFPIVLDMATSIAPEGKVRTYLQADKPLPSGWIVDAAGKPSFNAADFYAGGAILPLGGPAGHKGYGLGFMVDILAGAISGGGCCAPDPPPLSDNMLAIAIDVRQFTPFADFRRRVAALAEHVKTSPKAAGCEHIYVPGEIEVERRTRRLVDGIPIEPTLWKMLETICARFEVDLPEAA